MFTGVGERTREGNDLYHEMQETKVIQLDGDSKVALVFGQMNEPPGARARVALTGKPLNFVSSLDTLAVTKKLLKRLFHHHLHHSISQIWQHFIILYTFSLHKRRSFGYLLNIVTNFLYIKRQNRSIS